MKKLTYTMEEWVQLVEDELKGGHFNKASKIQSKLAKTKNKSGLFQPIYKHGWLAYKRGDTKVAESLFSWLKKIDPKNWQAHLANAMLRQQSVGTNIVSREFRKFVASNPVYLYQQSSSKNPINTATLLTVGKKDINFTSGGFSLPYGLTELQHLTKSSEYTATMLFCEGLSSKQADRFDILINAVSDADVYPELLEKLNTLLEDSNTPIINHPRNMLKNTRDNLAKNVPSDMGVIVPKTIRVKLDGEQRNNLACQINENDLHYPLLVRPIGSQTGQGLTRLDMESQTEKYQDVTGWFYITDFNHFRSTDGYYRKYRCWSIGDQVVPNHLFIHTEWNVHGTSRFETMMKNEWMLLEEQSFLDGGATNGYDKVNQMITTIKNVTRLDYFGVDFSFTQDNEPILFEANPTMRSNYPEWVAPFPYTKKVGLRHIEAFQSLVESKIKNA